MDVTRGVYTNLAIPSAAPSAMLFADWESATNPAEVVRVDLGTRTHKPISDFNGERVAQLNGSRCAISGSRASGANGFTASSPCRPALTRTRSTLCSSSYTAGLAR